VPYQRADRAPFVTVNRDAAHPFSSFSHRPGYMLGAMRLLSRSTAVVVSAISGLCVACSGSNGATSASSTSPSMSSSAGPSSQPTSPSVTSQAAVPVESNPPGDIPDNLAFVPYSNPAGRYRFAHPEGWAEIMHGASVRFSDKLNGVTASVVAARQAPTIASAKHDDVPRLRSSVPAFELRSVSSVTLPGGPAVLIVFRRNSDPDAVTGRQYRDEVREFLLWHSGREIRFDLFGPVGADNVDAYRTMSNSLRLT
jgi:hypothetical protein